MTSHIQCVGLGKGEGGSPSPERQQQGMRDSPPTLPPPPPQMPQEGGAGGGVTLQKSAVQLSPGDNAGGPRPPPGSQSVGTSPPYTPIWGRGPHRSHFGGGGVVIHSATLGCPPPHFATDLLRYILFFFLLLHLFDAFSAPNPHG